MGAWGEKGFDNDTAMDWLDPVVEDLKFKLLRGFWSRHEEEGVAAAQFLIELSKPLQDRLGVHVFSEALEFLDNEITKLQTRNDWKHPLKRKNYIFTLRGQIFKRHGGFPKPRRRRIKRSI